MNVKVLKVNLPLSICGELTFTTKNKLIRGDMWPLMGWSLKVER
jgi:hypothetical protein